MIFIHIHIVKLWSPTLVYYSIYLSKINPDGFSSCICRKKTIAFHFSFSGNVYLSVLKNKVEVLLFQSIVYIHRKKRISVWLLKQIQEPRRSRSRSICAITMFSSDQIISKQRSKIYLFPIEYLLGGSSFSGERSCAHNVQEVGSQTPGRVVVRLSMCSNICSL